MEFTLTRRVARYPFLAPLMRGWMRAGLPVPAAIRLQIANEFHAELIARLMAAMAARGTLDRAGAMAAARALGAELAPQMARLMPLDTRSAACLARLIDFTHATLNIGGKRVVEATPARAVSHWGGCSLARQLHQSPAGAAYCDLYQAAYQGALAALNPNARANDLGVTRSRGCDHCELITWIEPA